jgi:hypothetical protein
MKMTITDNRGSQKYEEAKQKTIEALENAIEMIKTTDKCLLVRKDEGQLKWKKNRADEGKRTGLCFLHVEYYIESEDETNGAGISIRKEGQQDEHSHHSTSEADTSGTSEADTSGTIGADKGSS